MLILEAAEALARRDAAETALSEASDALTGALEQLQRHGFELTEVAALLEVSPTELAGTPGSRRQSPRTSRSDPGSEAGATEESDTSIRG
jgi:hypothetical protein